MKNKIVFLFGAGISLPAGIPSTYDITKMILSAEDQSNKRKFLRIGDGRYVLEDGNFNDWSKNNINSIQLFLEYISKFIRPYFDREINYEDIFYCVDQIISNKPPVYEYENPLIDPFIKRTIPIIKRKCEENLYTIAQESSNYIRGVITTLLSGPENQSINHLSFLKEAHSNFPIDVFTLNHDLLLDTFFSELNSCESKISVVDGFENENNKLRVWNPELFNTSFDIKYIKLHGSVDWFRFATEEESTSNPSRLNRIFKIPNFDNNFYNNTKIYSFTDENGNKLYPSLVSLILIGLFNKMFFYTTDIYMRLQYEFYRSLLASNRLIVSGYSFGDKGINSVIIDWLYYNSNNRLIILHDNPEVLRNSARKAINYHWKELIKEGTMRIVEKKVDVNLSWKDISPVI